MGYWIGAIVGSTADGPGNSKPPQLRKEGKPLHVGIQILIGFLKALAGYSRANSDS
jgi:hypothetical protein